jgi:hypothetical protein
VNLHKKLQGSLFFYWALLALALPVRVMAGGLESQDFTSLFAHLRSNLGSPSGPYATDPVGRHDGTVSTDLRPYVVASHTRYKENLKPNPAFIVSVGDGTRCLSLQMPDEFNDVYSRIPSEVRPFSRPPSDKPGANDIDQLVLYNPSTHNLTISIWDRHVSPDSSDANQPHISFEANLMYPLPSGAGDAQNQQLMKKNQCQNLNVSFDLGELAGLVKADNPTFQGGCDKYFAFIDCPPTRDGILTNYPNRGRAWVPANDDSGGASSAY